MIAARECIGDLDVRRETVAANVNERHVMSRVTLNFVRASHFGTAVINDALIG